MDGFFKLHKKRVFILTHGHVANIRTGYHKAIGMNGIRRVGYQNCIARAGSRKRQVCKTLFGTQGYDCLGVWIQVDVIALFIPVADRPAQPRNALGLGITVGIATARGFHHLVDDMLRGGLVRVAHAEIDNIFAGSTCLLFQLTDNIENIGWQALNTLKLLVHD